MPLLSYGATAGARAGVGNGCPAHTKKNDRPIVELNV